MIVNDHNVKGTRMAKTISKRAFIALATAMLAMVATLSMASTAFADYVSAQADDDVVFTVKTKTLIGYDADGKAEYSEPEAAKTYTQAELDAITITDSAEQAPAYLMLKKNKSGGPDSHNVYVAPKYILISELLKDAGIDDADAVGVVSFIMKSDGSVWGNAATPLTGSRIAQDLKFFPNHESTERKSDNAKAAPAIILFWNDTA